MVKDKLSIDINAIIGHDSTCERKNFQDLKVGDVVYGMFMGCAVTTYEITNIRVIKYPQGDKYVLTCSYTSNSSDNVKTRIFSGFEGDSCISVDSVGNTMALYANKKDVLVVLQETIKFATQAIKSLTEGE